MRTNCQWACLCLVATTPLGHASRRRGSLHLKSPSGFLTTVLSATSARWCVHMLLSVPSSSTNRRQVRGRNIRSSLHVKLKGKPTFPAKITLSSSAPKTVLVVQSVWRLVPMMHSRWSIWIHWTRKGLTTFGTFQGIWRRVKANLRTQWTSSQWKVLSLNNLWWNSRVPVQAAERPPKSS